MRLGDHAGPAGLSGLVDAIYEAGISGGNWEIALELTASVFNADDCAIVCHDFPGGSGVHLFAVPELAAERHRYTAEIACLNPWTAASKETHYRLSGTPFRARDLVPTKMLKDSRFYRECLKPRNLLHNMRLVLDRDGGKCIYLSLSRTARRPDFDADDLALLQSLYPHFRRALRAWSTRSEAHAREQATSRALGTLAIGLIIVNKDGQALYQNDVASQLLHDEDGISLGQLGLELKNGSRRLSLRQLLGALCDRPAGGVSESTVSFSIPRRSGAKSLSAFVMPIEQAETVQTANSPVAVVYIFDPEARSKTDWKHLCGLYGLTRTEAKVAGKLADGNRVDEIRQVLSVSDNTVRTHVKNIMQKTNTKRQAELVRMLASGPAMLRLTG